MAPIVARRGKYIRSVLSGRVSFLRSRIFATLSGAGFLRGSGAVGSLFFALLRKFYKNVFLFLPSFFNSKNSHTLQIWPKIEKMPKIGLRLPDNSGLD